MKAIFIYDGSFEGFLTAVYKVFEEKRVQASIVKPKHHDPDIFTDVVEVVSDSKRAALVWKSLCDKATKNGANKFYKAFLSEIKGVENVLLRYMMYAYSTESFIHTDYTNKDVLRVSQVAQMVNREQQRTEESIKFKVDVDGVRIANIATDFNLLPLIAKHFETRYSNLEWVINDLKRGYGLSYDLNMVKVVGVETDCTVNDAATDPLYFEQEELPFMQPKGERLKKETVLPRKNRGIRLQQAS